MNQKRNFYDLCPNVLTPTFPQFILLTIHISLHTNHILIKFCTQNIVQVYTYIIQVYTNIVQVYTTYCTSVHKILYKCTQNFVQVYTKYWTSVHKILYKLTQNFVQVYTTYCTSVHIWVYHVYRMSCNYAPLLPFLKISLCYSILFDYYYILLPRYCIL